MTKFFTNQTKEVLSYFENWLQKGDTPSDSIFCDLYDTFHDEHHTILSAEIEGFHNCVGCSLDEGANNILEFLQKNTIPKTSVRYYVTIFSYLFYSQAERLAVFYKEFGYVNGSGQFDWEKTTRS